jgi:uncharacterized protein (TIGR03067 family)
MFRSHLPAALAALLAVPGLVGLGLGVPPARTGGEKVAWKDGWEGPWSVVSWTESGQQAPGDYSRAIQVTFRRQHVTFSLFGERREGPFRIDGTKSPGHFDLWLDGREEPRRAIYRLERDRLTLCFVTWGDKRPTRFESNPGSDTILIVLKRGAVRLDAAEERRARAWFQLEEVKPKSRENLKWLTIAMHYYSDSDQHKPLPPPAITSKDGKPLLSWRVAILPYLLGKVDYGPLYKEFKMDEPWDSEHNKKLLPFMPKIYAPVRGMTKEPHSTYYQAFVGPGAAFEPGKKMRLPVSFPDGTSNTIFFVEAGEAVPWTKPADLPYDPKKALPKLGGLFPDGFHVGMVSGSVQWVNRRFNERGLRLAITRDDGEVLPDGLLFSPGSCLSRL